MYDKFSGFMKIPLHLDHVTDCKPSSGTDWLNERTYRVSIRNTRRDWIVDVSAHAPCPLRNVLRTSVAWADAICVQSVRSVHTNRPRSGGAAATFAGGWPDELRGKAAPPCERSAGLSAQVTSPAGPRNLVAGLVKLRNS